MQPRNGCRKKTKFPICFLKEKANEEISLSENLIANVRMGNLRRRYRRECISTNQVTFKQELIYIVYIGQRLILEVKKKKESKVNKSSLSVADA